ncbi:class I SAM-dependent methyltransferase [Mycobacterium vicinigordonae]|nr:class I SAM-dependent methyltransferase [Mycobacterium vicinigordonae]
MSIELGEIQETLLIPLYGRALDAQNRRSVLGDRRAAEFVEAIDYDFAKFSGPSLAGSVLRASIFDGYVEAFLQQHPSATVVDVGCGLSTRFDRLDNGVVRWFDIDLEDTMALRHRFFEEHDRYTMITASIFGTDWYDVVRPEPDIPVLLLSEAVLLYFPESEVRAVLARLADAFRGCRIAFDTAGPVMMNNQDRNPVFKAVTARMQWTCADPAQLQTLGLRLRESRTFASPPPHVGRRWPAKYRYGLKLLGWAPPVSTYKMNLFDTQGALPPQW